MSLRDRLKSTQKIATTKPKQEQPLKYYDSDEDAKLSENLGVLDNILIDDELNSIFVGGAKQVYLERRGKVHKSTTTFRDNVQLENIFRKVAQSHSVDSNITPCFSFSHKLGINITATLPPLSNVTTLFVKCYFDKHATLQEMQEENSVSKEIALIIETLCSIKKNILIIGENSTLKTTLLSSMAKKMPINNRAVVIDKQHEIKIDNSNCINYDFLNFNDENVKDSLLTSIIDSKPDRIFINDDSNELFAKSIRKSLNKYRGLVLTLNAINYEDALDKAAQYILENDSTLSYEKAKGIVLSTFDVIIHTKKDELGRRRVDSLAQINLLAQDGYIQEIFNYDNTNQHKSTGIIPMFYEDIKMSSLPIGDNIFDFNYKHTYSKAINSDLYETLGRKGNLDILKKFKKDLPALDENHSQDKKIDNPVEENSTEEQNQNNSEDLMKKAQEKFDELKRNAQFNIDSNSNDDNVNE
ncbi:Flp pilus assembly complex ATPase component TadA [bacterium]|nr:Flp pilus assembly complex ATPase component TadA [bacterium]